MRSTILYCGAQQLGNERERAMGLGILVLGLAIFHANHLFVTMRDARAGAIARIGLPLYRVLFSLASTIGLVLIVWGFAEYRAHGWIDVWQPPLFMRHITIGLMLIAVVLLTAQFIPSHIKSWTKYPALAAIKTWAFAHLLSNGDLGSILLFGSFLAWAVYARIKAKRRGAELPEQCLPMPTVETWSRDPHAWLSMFNQDFVVLVVGMLIYVALGYAFHPVVIGVPVFGR